MSSYLKFKRHPAAFWGIVLALAATISVVSLPVHAGSRSYLVTLIPTLGGPSNTVNGINANGQVVGVSDLKLDPGRHHAFLLSTSGYLQDLGAIPGSYRSTLSSAASAVNDSGEVTGSAISPTDGRLHAFLYDGGPLQDLGTLGGTGSGGYGINDSGLIAGGSEKADFTAHAFLVVDGVMKDLGTLGGHYSYATGVNASGAVTGESTLSDNTTQHSFIYSNRAMHDIGILPGGTISQAYAINASDEVTGVADDVSGQDHAFLYSNGVMTDLDPASGSSVGFAINSMGEVVGASDSQAALFAGGTVYKLTKLLPPTDQQKYALTYATGINDKGQITANGYLIQDPSTYRAFLLSPNRKQ